MVRKASQSIVGQLLLRPICLNLFTDPHILEPTTIQFMPVQSPADYSDGVDSTFVASTAIDVAEAVHLPPIFLPQNAASITGQGRYLDPAAEPPNPSSKKVTRPRNAFMLFRTHFCKNRIAAGVERDHRHISRIVGHCWNMLSDNEKDEWRRLAEREKLEHQRLHPGWKFRPSPREKKPLKRKVKRNGPEDLARSRKLAVLVREGKSGAALQSAFLRSSEEPFSSPSPDASMDSGSASPASGTESVYHYDFTQSPMGYHQSIDAGKRPVSL